MKFEFAKYTEITDLYKKNSTMLQDGDGYSRFFICPDTHVFWLIRVIENMNEEYEREEGVFLVERNNIEKDFKGEKLTIPKLLQIIQNDTFENWDITEVQSFDEVIDILDDGFGVLNLKENSAS